MLSERVFFIVMQKSDQSVQLGVAEPAGVGISNSPLFGSQEALKSALEAVGLPGKIAYRNGLSEPQRVSFLQLVSLGFF